MPINNNRPLPDEVHTLRFWTKVDQSGGPDACWPWLGFTTKDGYGIFSLYRKSVIAGRVAYAIEHGHWPVHGACHNCDNPPCCNPKHLFDGTQKQNSDDMMAKNRHNPPRGVRNYNAKLTDEDVINIRHEAMLGHTQAAIAERYGIRQHHVSRLVNGKARAHVVDERRNVTFSSQSVCKRRSDEGDGWRTVARYKIEPPGTPGRSDKRWTASAYIQGFEPNQFRDYGTTEMEALSNLMTSIRGRDPKKRTDFPDDIMGILAD